MVKRDILKIVAQECLSASGGLWAFRIICHKEKPLITEFSLAKTAVSL
jgi:hypothetical protein